MKYERDSVIQFAPLTETLERLESHGLSPNVIARRDIERYHDLLDWSMTELGEHFTVNELCLITDACNGIAFDDWGADPARRLYVEISGAIEIDGKDEKWEVDAEVLKGKLRDLSISHAAAVIDAIERWWRDPSPQLTKEGFAKYGLKGAEQ